MSKSTTVASESMTFYGTGLVDQQIFPLTLSLIFMLSSHSTKLSVTGKNVVLGSKVFTAVLKYVSACVATIFRPPDFYFGVKSTLF